MRKYYVSDKWKKVQRIRLKYRLRERARIIVHLQAKAELRQQRKEFRDLSIHPPETVPLPSIFSFINKSGFEETIEAINKIERHIRKHENVYIEMKSVEDITLDAIIVLLTKIREASNKKCHISGSHPINRKVLSMLISCDFYKYVSSRDYTDRNNKRQTITYKQMNKVSSEELRPLVNDAFSRAGVVINQERRQKLSSVLVELMNNAIEHSKETKANSSFWIGLLPDESKQKILFVFHDNGLGIIKTVKNRIRDKIFRENRVIIRDLFNTDLAKKISRALKEQKKGRGNGLRTIHRYQEYGIIENLWIATDNVVGNVTNDTYFTSSSHLKGTLLTWEISNEQSNSA
ncbi:MAG: sensor histidine kinase [Candidatus Kapabacteria bacterium]|nr:sensor histidine kinase [Candidatus Kapabacteria bacterium]